MLSCQWRSSEIWSVVKGRHSPTVSCTTQPVYVEQGTTGSSSEVTSLPWWTRSVCPQCSSLTVLQTFSGQNWHASSVLKILTPAQLATKLSKRTPLSLTGSSIVKFIDAFYTGVLGASDYWFRFEWQHRGSPHVHGLAWLPDAPDVEQVHADSEEISTAAKEALLQYVDKIVSTTNPAVLPDWSNVDEAPPPKTNPHICNQPYSEVEDLDQDLTDLIATCQRHTRCSAAYCLRTSNGQQKCRFGYPKPLQPETALVMEDEDPVLLTARNDGLINNFNPVQLSA